MTDPETTGRFAGRVAEYARWRPGYPPELLALLREELGLKPGDVVADVGSGTGLLSRLFRENGHPVLAVEPDPEMRRVAEEELGGVPGFRSVAGRAEETNLEAGSVDLVVAGQAFHWFDRDAAREEFRRILREPRRVALVWYTRVVGAGPFMEALERLLLEHGTDYRSVRHDRIPGG
nr:class I SAM-dependent methyltransferase [Gemmatimonadota bacterium]NIR79606.1 class I SAM-dependent methyltransferase [Gemmatimonadota bacterium]NIT88663.1 class I SAM-dependent methyltransferase [Gemmatimonadota bacterium]NIU32101.1 class I SAM-dependent methyltransferase [Gemmatimonadota bacterium]NIU36696.1 methyltransferase domain-containing protein [Gemmatimonadota bacterium]